MIAPAPRIVPFGGCPVTPEDAVDLDRATSPLLLGPLLEAPRPWEPMLPDARDRPKFPWFPRAKRDGETSDAFLR